MSADDRQTRLKVCKHIRSKESFHSETPLEEDDFHSGIYWCNMTGDGMGPDGTCADSQDCGPDRECYES